MTLKTASIVDLREQTTSRIHALEQRLDSASFPHRGKYRSISTRLSRLYSDHCILENASTTLAQRKSFGLEAWHNSFTRLKDIRALPNCPLSAEALRTEAWKALPSGKFKRFQELFCEPHNFVVPKFSYQHGKIQFATKEALSKLSVAGCLVSPDRIPDEFAEAVGLVQFTDCERRNPRLRYLRKTEVEALNRLKLLWDAALPLSSQDFGVLAIQRPSDKQTTAYESSWSFPRGLHGTLLFSKEDTSDRIQKNSPPFGPKKVRPLRIQHFTTTYDAYRGALHASFGYRSESQQLATHAAQGSMALRRLADDYKKDAPAEVKSDIRRGIEKTLREGVRYLAKAVNQNKTSARELMAAVSEFKDSLGRVNPGVVGSRIAHSTRSLGERLAEIRGKHGHNQKDEDLLGEILQREYTILRSLYATLTQHAPGMMERRDGAASRMERIAPALVMSKLVPDRGALQEITTRPFSTFAGLLRLGCAELERCLTRKDYAGARRSAAKMHTISQLFLVNDNIQRMSEYLATPDSIPLPELQRELQEAQRTLHTTLLLSVKIDGHERALTTLSEQLDAIEKTLRTRADGASKDAEDFFKVLKRQLNETTPERIAWRFVPKRR